MLKSTKCRLSTGLLLLLAAAFVSIQFASGAAIAAAKQTVEERTKLNSDEIVAVNRASEYFNKLRDIIGEFVQIGPGTHFSEGKFYLSKPGKLRFEYKPPFPLLVVSDGTWLIVNNKKLNTADHYPLSATPLGLVLSDKVDLLEDARIIHVYQDPAVLTITLEDKGALVSGQLTLVFDNKTMELRQWIIVDGQGNQITISLRNVVFDKKPDPKLFVLKLPNEIETTER